MEVNDATKIFYDYFEIFSPFSNASYYLRQNKSS